MFTHPSLSGPDHVDMRDAAIVVDVRASLESEPCIKAFQVCLGAQFDPGSGLVSLDMGNRCGHHPLGQAIAPRILGNSDTADGDGIARQDAQNAYKTAVAVRSQMQHRLILIVKLWVKALLFQDENVEPEFQEGVEQSAV